VQLALNDNPSPDHALQLNDLIADLETLKDELIAMRDELENGQVKIPPPEPPLIAHVKDLVKRVESARTAGTTASAIIALAGQSISAGLAVMSLAK
jgi:hypothetical protein